MTVRSIAVLQSQTIANCVDAVTQICITLCNADGRARSVSMQRPWLQEGCVLCVQQRQSEQPCGLLAGGQLSGGQAGQEVRDCRAAAAG